MSPSARECAKRAEQQALMPGNDERFAGYGIMGLPFASGHVLALRRFPASSVGPGYTSVWHRDPAGRWTFYTDTDPMESCNRYFGSAVDQVVMTPIEVDWPAESRITVRAPGRIEWESRLEQNMVARVMSGVSRVMPDTCWRSGLLLSAMSGVATRALRAGRLKLQGTAPNGQRFVANPKLIWFIPESSANVLGVDLGPVGALNEQARLRDFMIPQRGIFAVGGASFDVLDPARHRAVSTRDLPGGRK